MGYYVRYYCTGDLGYVTVDWCSTIEEAWLTAFPDCSETKELVLKAESFIKKYEEE